MPTGKSQRKEFEENQKSLIMQLRDEGKSVDTVAAILMVGKERVRRFCKENNLGVYQNTKNPRCNIGNTQKIVDFDKYPDFTKSACRQMDTMAFFPGAPPQGRIARQKYDQEVRTVIQVCQECQIQEECLNYALETEPYGIWGGATEIEREYLRAKLKIECQREITLTRVARKARLGFMSPALAPTYDAQFGSSVVVKSRLAKSV